MESKVWNDLEVAPRSVVMEAARQFAGVLVNTPQYKGFEQAYHSFSQDEGAQSALREFQKKQSSLKMMLMLNAVSEEDRQELQRLQEQFYQQPSVLHYSKAQEDLIVICQELGDILSEAIGLDYASSCRTGGCCG